MRRLIEYSAAHYIAVLLFLAFVTVITAFQLPQLRVDVSPEGLMVTDTPERRYYESILNEFGTDNITIVVIRDLDIQSPESLLKIKRIVDRLSGFDFVRRIESLYSAQHIWVENDNVMSSPYLDPAPASEDMANRILEKAGQNPLIAKNLLSEDGDTMAINIYLDDISLEDKQDSHITNSIESVLQYYEVDFEEIYQIGLPYVRHTLEEQVIDDQLTLVPQSFLILIVVLIVILRNLNGGLIPLITSITSIVWVLGLMAALDIPLTLVTAIVPMLLIIIGSTEDVHLVSEYLLAKKEGKTRSEAVRVMARRKGFASLMTFITSWFGFASVAVNPLEILREFSIVASSGLLVNYLVTMLLVPSWLCVFGSKKSRKKETGHALKVFKPVLDVICYIVHQRKQAALLVIGLVCVVSLYGASQIRLNNNIMAYFDDSSPIKMRADDVAESLAGIESFMIVLDAGIEGTFLHHKYLSQLSSLTNRIDNAGVFDKATSFADHMALMNSVVNETSEIVLPDDDYVINELSIFINHDEVKQYIDRDFSKAVIHVRHHIGSSYEFNQALKRLHKCIDENIDDAIKVTITGESVLVNDAADTMAAAQAKSLALILLIIFIIISLIFVNIHAGLLSIAPNLLPIIIMFGVMGFWGIPLDTGTAMIAVISIGVIVDDTMHFMVRYNEELSKTFDESNAIARTIRAEALPIISTSIALALGFLAMMQSSFLPIVHFGALSATVMIVALVAEFVLTPILLSSVRLVTLWDVLSLHLKDKLLTRCKLFRGMRPWQVKKLILLSHLRKYKAGETIMQSGDPATEMYILLDGSVNIYFNDDNGEHVIKESSESGRLFGMLRVNEEEKRGTGAIATEDASVLVISWQSIEQIARFYPRISSLFFKNLSSILGGRLIEQIQVKTES
ncbi:MAG: MMPL family transporter [Gammaproteobacteria bacterium]|nr:MMPL family transporter [Gammaproteobacteria bacterium]